MAQIPDIEPNVFPWLYRQALPCLRYGNLIVLRVVLFYTTTSSKPTVVVGRTQHLPLGTRAPALDEACRPLAV